MKLPFTKAKTADDLRAEQHRIRGLIGQKRDERKVHEAKLVDLLIEGDHAKIDAHEKAAEKIDQERKILEARLKALPSLIAAAQLDEDERTIGTQIAELTWELDALDEARRAAAAAEGRARRAMRAVDEIYARAGNMTPAHCRGSLLRLPSRDEVPVARANQLLGGRWQLPARPPEADPDAPRVVVDTAGGTRFEGKWSAKDLAELKATGASYPHEAFRTLRTDGAEVTNDAASSPKRAGVRSAGISEKKL